MKTILVVAINEDGEHDIRCGQVEERLVPALLACDGLVSLEPETEVIRAALSHVIDYYDDEWSDRAQDYFMLFDGCEVSPQAGLPAVDHVIRFYTV